MSLGGSSKTPELTKLELPDFTEGFTDFLKQKDYLGDLADFKQQIDDLSNTMFQERIYQFAPTAQSDIQTLGTQASALLKGELPEDVSDYIKRQSAATAYSTGVGTTSGMGRNLTLRDLGLTSLDSISTGASLLNRQLQMADFMNPSNYDVFGSNLFTTKELLGRKDNQAISDWQVENQNNQIRAANSNQSSGIGSTIGGVLGGASGAYFGGPVGAGLGMSLGSSLGGAIEGGTPTSSSSGLSSIFSSLGGSFYRTGSMDWNKFSLSPKMSKSTSSLYSAIPTLFQ